MHRRAMHGGKPRRYLYRADRIGRFQRAHRNDHRAVEAAGAALSRILVRYIGTFVPRSMCRTGTPFCNKRFLERKRAADHETHKVVPPNGIEIGRLAFNFAVFPYAIARNIRANVEIVAERRNFRDSRFGHAEHGHGFGFAWQNRRNSSAQSRGRIARFPCT